MLKNFSIKQGFYFLAIVTFGGLIFTLLVNVFSAGTTNDRLTRVSAISYPVLEMATSNNIQLIRLADVIANAVTVGEEDALTSSDEILAEMLALFDKQAQLLPEQSSTIQKLNRETSRYHQEASELARGIINGNVDFATVPQRAERNAELLENLKSELAKFKADAESDFNDELQSVESSVNEAVFANVLAGAVIVIVVGFVGTYISRSLMKSLYRITSSLSAIAQGEGDLTRRIEHDRKDELADLVYWFNTFVEKLQGNIVNTKESVTALKEVTYTLASSSHESSEQVAQQTETLAQTMLALEGLFESVAAISESASVASEEAQQADNQAQQGQGVVTDTSSMISNLASEVQHSTEVVNRLDGFANNVTAIVATIQGIAEQTNLLALNAAIEAARAGEQGRGFAVVADEVRTLASRTQQSTLEIQQVIEELVTTSDSAVQAMDKGQKTAEQSVALSSEASIALNQITEKVERIVHANSSIADVTLQQKDASEQIQAFITQLDGMSKEAEQNMSNLDQVSHSIKDITGQLDEVTRQFKV